MGINLQHGNAKQEQADGMRKTDLDFDSYVCSWNWTGKLIVVPISRRLKRPKIDCNPGTFKLCPVRHINITVKWRVKLLQ